MIAKQRNKFALTMKRVNCKKMLQRSLKNLTIILVFSFIFVIIFFSFSQFVYGFFSLIFFVGLVFFWYLRLKEDLIIYYLKINFERIQYY